MTFLSDLEAIVQDRLTGQQPFSYTHKLVRSGMDRVLRKIGEEAAEVIIAGKNQDKEEILNESADLLYHLMVMLAAQGLSLTEVTAWFAGMFFLGRMVIYLAEAITAKQDQVVTLMNTAIRRVTFIIVLPSTVITVGLGLWLMVLTQAYTSPWFHLKMTLIFVLLGQQHYLFRIVKQLRKGEVRHRPLFLRLFNELPFFLLLGIVLTVDSRDTFSGIIGMGLLVLLVGGIFGLRAVFKKKSPRT